MWDGHTPLIEFSIVRRKRKRGDVYLAVPAVDDAWEPRAATSWEGALVDGLYHAQEFGGDTSPFKGFVMEDGFIGAHRMRAALVVAEMRGRAVGAMSMSGIPLMARVTPAEWARVASEHWTLEGQKVSWPSDSASRKELSKALVKEHTGRTLTDDEADAHLIARWFVWTGGLHAALASQA